MDSYGLDHSDRSETWIASEVGDYELGESDLGWVLAPLAAYRKNMLVVSGIDLSSQTELGGGVAHHSMTSHAMTGSRGIGGIGAMRHVHASIDYHIGEFLSGEYGLLQPRVYPHLAFSDYAEPSKIPFVYSSNGDPVRSIAGPDSILASVFGSTSEADAEAEVRLLRAQILSLDHVGDSLQSIRGQLINANKDTVIDAYRSSVEDLAKELEIRSEMVCTPPAVSDGESVAQIFEYIYYTFACDFASSVFYSPGGEQINQLKHGFLFDVAEHSAATHTELKKNMHAISHSSTAASFAAQAAIRGWQMRLLAGLLDRMATTPDVDGTSTLLDNTVVFVTSAMSNNTHDSRGFPETIVAGKNTNLKGGWHYDCASSTNNDLLTTLAQGLTCPLQSFGGYDGGGNFAGGPINTTEANCEPARDAVSAEISGCRAFACNTDNAVTNAQGSPWQERSST